MEIRPICADVHARFRREAYGPPPARRGHSPGVAATVPSARSCRPAGSFPPVCDELWLGGRQCVPAPCAEPADCCTPCDPCVLGRIFFGSSFRLNEYVLNRLLVRLALAGLSRRMRSFDWQIVHGRRVIGEALAGRLDELV